MAETRGCVTGGRAAASFLFTRQAWRLSSQKEGCGARGVGGDDEAADLSCFVTEQRKSRRRAARRIGAQESGVVVAVCNTAMASRSRLWRRVSRSGKMFWYHPLAWPSNFWKHGKEEGSGEARGDIHDILLIIRWWPAHRRAWSGVPPAVTWRPYERGGTSARHSRWAR